MAIMDGGHDPAAVRQQSAQFQQPGIHHVVHVGKDRPCLVTWKYRSSKGR